MATTIHDIARESGVSARTVSRALNGRGYVAESTRARIQAVVDRHGFLPSRLARSLRTGFSHEVCVVLSVRPGDLIMEEVAAMEKPLRQAGYWISILHVDSREATRGEVAAELRDRRPAALVTVYSRNVVRFLEHFEVASGDLAHGMIDLRDFTSRLDGVIIDRHSGIRDSIRYLYEQGHRRIAYLGLPADPSRVEGYRRAVRELGVPEIFLPFTDLRSSDPDYPSDRFESGRRAAEAFLAAEPRPDAVQAFSDEVALGLIAGLHARGVRVPDDLALVGFDNRQVASWCTPALTTVAQPTRDIGEAAAGILLDRIDHNIDSAAPRRITLPTRLIVRDSA